MSHSLFAPDYRSEPYWWETAPRPALSPMDLPARCDVVVIGSGYTGLAAALELARAGRQVLVIDSEEAGWGCSSRNGGQVSESIKPSLEKLASRHGAEAASAIRGEGRNALQWIGDFIRREGIDCNFVRCGHFTGAHNAAAFRSLVRGRGGARGAGADSGIVLSRDEQRQAIGSDFYHGGVLYPEHASLHPAKFHRGLLARACEAGVQVMPRCAATRITRVHDEFIVQTTAGLLQARDLIVATNGYTGSVTASLRRRVIPIGSYIIATELLPETLTARLIPHDRTISDTRKVVFYYRLSEDRRRMLFGGRVAVAETNPDISALPLHRHMVRIFPELAQTRISYSWCGFVAYTFDELPHVGRNAEGIYYSMGYCGSGVSLAPYLGTRLAQQLLGRPEGRTALDGLQFQTRPTYTGKPWFLPGAIAVYRLRDRLPVVW